MTPDSGRRTPYPLVPAAQEPRLAKTEIAALCFPNPFFLLWFLRHPLQAPEAVSVAHTLYETSEREREGPSY